MADLFRLPLLDGDAGTDLPGWSGTASVRLSLPRAIDDADVDVTSGGGYFSVRGPVRSRSLLLQRGENTLANTRLLRDEFPGGPPKNDTPIKAVISTDASLEKLERKGRLVYLSRLCLRLWGPGDVLDSSCSWIVGGPTLLVAGAGERCRLLSFLVPLLRNLIELLASLPVASLSLATGDPGSDEPGVLPGASGSRTSCNSALPAGTVSEFNSPGVASAKWNGENRQ